MNDAQFSGVNDVQIDQRPQMLVIGPGGVELDQPILANRLIDGHQPRFAAAGHIALQEVLHAPVLSRAGTAAKSRFQLHPVVARRVVAGGNHHPGRGAPIGDGIADGGSRRVGSGQQSANVIGGHHAGKLGRIAVGQKTGIEADDDRGVCRLFFPHEVSDGLGHQSQVVEGEFLADDGTPAVGAKLYRHNLSRSGLSVTGRMKGLRSGR